MEEEGRLAVGDSGPMLARAISDGVVPVPLRKETTETSKTKGGVVVEKPPPPPTPPTMYSYNGQKFKIR